MKLNKRTKFLGWMVFFLCLIGLMVWGRSARKNGVCQGIRVEIEGKNQAVFVDESKLIQTLKTQGLPIEGQPMKSIDLHKLEAVLMKNAWIQHSKLYFDNDNMLTAKVKECEPVARIFTMDGTSFYTDTNCHILPDGYGVALKLPVFTSFPSSNQVLSKPDSSLLREISEIGTYVTKDTFWNAFISDINIAGNGDFMITPILGKTLINIGNSDSLDQKFNKIYTFYKTVLPKAGYAHYSKIDVQFDNQIVATVNSSLTVHKVTTASLAVDSLNLPKKDTMQKIIGQKPTSPKSSTVSKVEKKVDVKKKVVPITKATPKEKAKQKTKVATIQHNNVVKSKTIKKTNKSK